MPAKNLISIHQIRQDELLTFVLDNVPVVSVGGLGGGKSNASGVSFPVGSGVDEIQITFPNQSGIPFVSATVGNSGISDPYILCNILNKTTSGCLVGLSDSTNSANYYMDLLFSV